MGTASGRSSPVLVEEKTSKDDEPASDPIKQSLSDAPTAGSGGKEAEKDEGEDSFASNPIYKGIVPKESPLPPKSPRAITPAAKSKAQNILQQQQQQQQPRSESMSQEVIQHQTEFQPLFFPPPLPSSPLLCFSLPLCSFASFSKCYWILCKTGYQD